MFLTPFSPLPRPPDTRPHRFPPKFKLTPREEAKLVANCDHLPTIEISPGQEDNVNLHGVPTGQVQPCCERHWPFEAAHDPLGCLLYLFTVMVKVAACWAVFAVAVIVDVY